MGSAACGVGRVGSEGLAACMGGAVRAQLPAYGGQVPPQDPVCSNPPSPALSCLAPHPPSLAASPSQALAASHPLSAGLCRRRCSSGPAHPGRGWGAQVGEGGRAPGPPAVQTPHTRLGPAPGALTSISSAQAPWPPPSSPEDSALPPGHSEGLGPGQASPSSVLLLWGCLGPVVLLWDKVFWKRRQE